MENRVRVENDLLTEVNKAIDLPINVRGKVEYIITDWLKNNPLNWSPSYNPRDHINYFEKRVET